MIQCLWAVAFAICLSAEETDLIDPTVKIEDPTMKSPEDSNTKITYVNGGNIPSSLDSGLAPCTEEQIATYSKVFTATKEAQKSTSDETIFSRLNPTQWNNVNPNYKNCQLPQCTTPMQEQNPFLNACISRGIIGKLESSMQVSTDLLQDAQSDEVIRQEKLIPIEKDIRQNLSEMYKIEQKENQSVISTPKARTKILSLESISRNETIRERIMGEEPVDPVQIQQNHVLQAPPVFLIFASDNVESKEELLEELRTLACDNKSIVNSSDDVFNSIGKSNRYYSLEKWINGGSGEHDDGGGSDSDGDYGGSGSDGDYGGSGSEGDYEDGEDDFSEDGEGSTDEE